MEQQCEHTCGNCRNRVVDIYIDSFGEYVDEYCKKTYRAVEPYHEACEWWRVDDDNER